MSIDFEASTQRWRARWREVGRVSSQRFAARDEAKAFAEALEGNAAPALARNPSRNGVYAYETKESTR